MQAATGGSVVENQVVLGNVYDTLKSVNEQIKLYGVADDFYNEYVGKLSKLGTQIMQDLEVPSLKEALALARDTVLPEQSHMLFTDLHDFLQKSEVI